MRPSRATEDTLTVISKSLERLTERVTELTSKVQSLETKTFAVDSRAAVIEHQVKTNTADISVIQVETVRVAKEVTACSRATAAGPFSAYATDSIVYGGQQIVQFPTPRLNIGNHYDTARAVFTCPVQGVYYFAFSILSYTPYSPGNAPSVLLKRGDEAIIGVYVNVFEDDFVLMMSNSVLVQCAPGQEVYVETATDVEVAGATFGTCTFSGFYVGA